MKINPPKTIIDENEPFKGALFGREEFAKSLTRLLQNASENLVIFVNAPWGAGKTTFSEMWRAYLKQQNQDVIYFDAYAADYFDDPFVSFSGEILELVDKRFAEGKELIERREFKETVIEVGKRLTGLAAKVGLRAATLGAVDATHFEELKEIRTELAKGVSEIGSAIIEKKIENYAKEKDALKSFKKKLAKLAAKVKEEQEFPLTIIVDELDRCRPDFALGLLERIKHLFDVDGVAFVLLVNRDQIESYIQNVYGNKATRDYLLKFGSLFIDLPSEQPLSSHEYVKGRKDYCSLLFHHHELSKPVQNEHFLIAWIGVLSAHFSLTLREIEKTFAVMVLYCAALPRNQSITSMSFLLALLSTLKVKCSEIYKPLSKGQIAADEFFRISEFKQIDFEADEVLNPEFVNDQLNYCLLTNSELESLTPANRARIIRCGTWFGPNRNKVIPALCRQLDRFSLLPRS